MKTIKWLDHKWLVRNEPSTLGNEYVVLERKFWQSDLKRYGQVAMIIDASRKDVGGLI